MIAIAVDDEPIALDIVRSHASKVLTINLVEVFTNAFDAMRYLQQHPVDLMFLDIKMPDISGIDFLHSLSNPPMVIFTTAYSEHAVKSFELDAVDYLLKPFSLARFLKACNKAADLHHLRIKAAGTLENDFIFIKDSYEQIKVRVADILYIEAAGNYTRVHLVGDKLLSTRVPINEMIKVLPGGKFVRTHRAFIVAKDKIDKFDKTQIWLGKQIIPIGNTYSQCLHKIH